MEGFGTDILLKFLGKREDERGEKREEPHVKEAIKRRCPLLKRGWPFVVPLVDHCKG